MSKPFNVRIYGLLIHQHKLLIMEEPFMGNIVKKFPGGGLEFGEGTRDCLKREFKEELNLDIEIGQHFYTQDFFLQSGLDPKEQILMIYYLIKSADISKLNVREPEIKKLIWMDLSILTKYDLSLPADRLVVEMLRNEQRMKTEDDFDFQKDKEIGD